MKSMIANLSKQKGGQILAQSVKQVCAFSTSSSCWHDAQSEPKGSRLVELQKKLRAKTPLGKLDEFARHPYQESEPLKPWPNNTNPHTGEIGGPAGPEPTRYGDWERKGRVSDF